MTISLMYTPWDVGGNRRKPMRTWGGPANGTQTAASPGIDFSYIIQVIRKRPWTKWPYSRTGCSSKLSKFSHGWLINTIFSVDSLEGGLIVIWILGCLRRDFPGSSFRGKTGKPAPGPFIATGHLKKSINHKSMARCFLFLVRTWKKDNRISLGKN